MSDRLQELLRQRAAIQAHLAWLDREIAQAGPTDALSARPTSPPPPSTSLPNPDAPVSTPANAITGPDVETLFASYRSDPHNLRTDLRKGCLLYFFGALGLLILGIVAFYFVNRLIKSEIGETAPATQRDTPLER